MKKYMFVLLILAIACAFSVSTVMAADLEKYDFDGKFSMEMEKGLSFQKQEMDENSGGSHFPSPLLQKTDNALYSIPSKSLFWKNL